MLGFFMSLVEKCLEMQSGNCFFSFEIFKKNSFPTDTVKDSQDNGRLQVLFPVLEQQQCIS